LTKFGEIPPGVIFTPNFLLMKLTLGIKKWYDASYPAFYVSIKPIGYHMPKLDD